METGFCVVCDSTRFRIEYCVGFACGAARYSVEVQAYRTTLQTAVLLSIPSALTILYYTITEAPILSVEAAACVVDNNVALR